MPPHRPKYVSSITVGDFFTRHAEPLSLTLLGEEVGFDRPISESAMNRPGLALAGFFSFFAPKRVQVLGHAETSYLRKLPEGMRGDRFRRMCDRDIPCVVVARNIDIGDDLLRVANANQVPVFRTSMVTMNFLNTATILLEADFAPSLSLHGCMLDVRGIGVLLIGSSGAGKSETAIGLIERGASLVADDMVIVKLIAGELVAAAPPMARGFMEIRGIGIINVANLYGLTAIRTQKRLDLVALLKPVTHLNEVDRCGMTKATYEILGHNVNMVEIPVGPGRDTARLVTIAALDQQLRLLGFNMADQFNDKLIQHMQEAQGKQRQDPRP
ncbi:MAG: HPr(Ser) kinase/phosphatase [Akkermansiaceae bacterium]|nr:HPr(Ser) kinase/phosphatase [Akkermansiaceae bacterium]